MSVVGVGRLTTTFDSLPRRGNSIRIWINDLLVRVESWMEKWWLAKLEFDRNLANSVAIQGPPPQLRSITKVKWAKKKKHKEESDNDDNKLILPACLSRPQHIHNQRIVHRISNHLVERFYKQTRDNFSIAMQRWVFIDNYTIMMLLLLMSRAMMRIGDNQCYN